MKSFLRLAMTSGVLCAGLYATPSFTTVEPGGLVTGEPGQTVGWGFTITNDTTFTLFIQNSFFCGPGGDPALVNCTAPPPYDGITNFGPAFGVYTDYVAASVLSNFFLVGPHATVTETWDPVLQTGVGQYAIDPAAPIVSFDTGNLFIQYDEYNGNPFTTGTEVAAGLEMSAPATLGVTPEPATFALAGGALALLGALRRRKRA